MRHAFRSADTPIEGYTLWGPRPAMHLFGARTSKRRKRNAECKSADACASAPACRVFGDAGAPPIPFACVPLRRVSAVHRPSSCRPACPRRALGVLGRAVPPWARGFERRLGQQQTGGRASTGLACDGRFRLRRRPRNGCRQRHLRRWRRRRRARAGAGTPLAEVGGGDGGAGAAGCRHRRWRRQGGATAARTVVRCAQRPCGGGCIVGGGGVILAGATGCDAGGGGSGVSREPAQHAAVAANPPAVRAVPAGRAVPAVRAVPVIRVAPAPAVLRVAGRAAAAQP